MVVAIPDTKAKWPDRRGMAPRFRSEPCGDSPDPARRKHRSLAIRLQRSPEPTWPMHRLTVSKRIFSANGRVDISAAHHFRRRRRQHLTPDACFFDCVWRLELACDTIREVNDDLRSIRPLYCQIDNPSMTNGVL